MKTKTFEQVNLVWRLKNLKTYMDDFRKALKNRNSMDPDDIRVVYAKKLFLALKDIETHGKFRIEKKEHYPKTLAPFNDYLSVRDREERDDIARNYNLEFQAVIRTAYEVYAKIPEITEDMREQYLEKRKNKEV